MTSRSFLMENIIYPFVDIVRDTNIVKNYHFLNKSQWWEKVRIDDLQNKKLRRLVKHSYENVPYYRRLFKEKKINPEDIKCKDDLEKLPILTKKDIRVNFPENLLSKNIPENKILLGRTGGSTGEPLQFYRDKNSKSWGVAALHRFWNWAGLEFAEKKFQFSGGSLGGFLTKKSHTRLRMEKFLTGLYLFPAFELSDENLKKYINLIKENKKIRYLRGYPSPIFILAKYINENDLSIQNFNGILTTAEKLFDYQIKEIRKAFNCKIFDHYACGEIHGIASQCEESDLYHISDEHVIIENTDTFDKLIPARVTDLDNYAFPFIRYENGDLLKFKLEKCNCGRELSTIYKIEGRTHDFITTPHGDLIAGEFFPHLFQSIIGIDQYMILQETIDFLIIKIKPNSKFTQEELDIYIRKIKDYIGEEIKIKIEIKEDIPISKSGKRIFIKSKVSPQFDY